MDGFRGPDAVKDGDTSYDSFSCDSLKSFSCSSFASNCCMTEYAASLASLNGLGNTFSDGERSSFDLYGGPGGSWGGEGGVRGGEGMTGTIGGGEGLGVVATTGVISFCGRMYLRFRGKNGLRTGFGLGTIG